MNQHLKFNPGDPRYILQQQYETMPFSLPLKYYFNICAILRREQGNREQLETRSIGKLLPGSVSYRISDNHKKGYFETVDMKYFVHIKSNGLFVIPNKST